MLDKNGNQLYSLCDSYCQCSLCTVNHSIDNTSSIIKKDAKQYCLQTFLDYFPRNFPIPIVNTAFPKAKVFYYCKFGNRLMIGQYSKIAQHFPLATNVALFYPNKCTIAHKYQIMKEDSSFIYVQAYNAQIPFSIDFHKDQNFMDDVLEEKLSNLIKDMTNDEYFNLTEVNKQFLIWVHQDYKQEIFCKYMTKIYCQFIKQITGDIIISAHFEWIVQKLGFIRLSNVNNLVMQKSHKTKTFQQQYEQKILQKLKGDDQKSLEKILFSSFVAQSKVGFRVNNFRNQIRDIFQKQKLKILQKTEKQRTVQTKSLSDDVARLFLPQLHKYSNLREVLNDETKFKKVVLGIEQKKHSQDGKIPKRPVRSYFKATSLFTKHQRSKTLI